MAFFWVGTIRFSTLFIYYSMCRTQERPILMSRMPVVDDDYRNDPSVRCQSSSASMLRQRTSPLGVVRTSNRIGRTSAVVFSLPEMATRTVLGGDKKFRHIGVCLASLFDSIRFNPIRSYGGPIACFCGCCRSLVSSVSAQRSRRRGLQNELQQTQQYRTLLYRRARY